MNIIQQRAIDKLNAQNNETIKTRSSNVIIMIDSEIEMLDVKALMELTGYSEKTVLKLLKDPNLTKLTAGKRILVEKHEFIRYCMSGDCQFIKATDI